MSSFDELALRGELVEALHRMGFQSPTEVQQRVIPAALAGTDLQICAPTGSGKTASFLLPLLHLLPWPAGHSTEVPAPLALIVVPTRELAAQVGQVAQTLVAEAVSAPKVCLVQGGEALDEQIAALAAGCELLIATPGRLLELLRQSAVRLDRVRQLVLDEADRLLEMGFRRELDAILSQLPARAQTLLFSATFAPEVQVLADSLLQAPQAISLRPAVESGVRQSLGYLVNKGSKAMLLLQLLREQPEPRALVFVNRRDTADSLVKRLQKQGWAAAALHSGKLQEERSAALARLQSGELQLLVATDLAARGLDIEALPLVINFELPEMAAVYVHRIGRTARAGRTGLAISLICHGDRPALANIEALMGTTLLLRQHPDFPLTDRPAAEGEAKRPPRDKQANRRTAQKRSIKQFVGKSPDPRRGRERSKP
ncbi:MAG: DEAD/DEAH box helicase [Aeromonadaceae bacterium]